MPTIAEVLQVGMQHHKAGRLPAAEQAYRKILAIDPQHTDALHLAGVVAHQLGQSQLAVDYIQRAIALQPRAADPHYNLGLAHQALKQFDQAVACFRQALALDPSANPSAHYHLANALADQGKFDDAAVCYRRAVELEPNNTNALINLARALTNLGAFDEAVACYRRALLAGPDSAETHNRLALLLKRQGRLADAEQEFLTALRLRPELGEAHNQLGVLLIEQGRETDALRCFEEAVRLKPDDADAHNNLGNLCRARGLVKRGVLHCSEAIRFKPSFVEAHNNLGVAFRDLGQTAAALQSYERAVQLQPDYPDAHWNRALAWLSEGNYAAGWPEYEWRWKRRREEPRQFAQPAWNGSSLAGRTILLYAEQGLGDTLQFIRYAPLVKQRGGTVVVECQQELVRLLMSCRGIDRLVPRGEPLPAFDVQAALLSLPRIFGTTLENLPAEVPYLSAAPDRMTELEREFAGRNELKVGIIWQGNPSHQNDRFRSLSLSQMLPLTRVPGVRLYSLQKGAGRDQLAALSGPSVVVDLADRLHDFYDTAAAVASLDLVIGCDTSVVHLAGALGVSTWVLLPTAADWRWLQSRADSPWYPTLRLFRQSRRGVWDDVIESATQSLVRLVTRCELQET